MIAIPAIDLREGACVQLVGGSYADERIRIADPLGAAKRWAAAGFRRLHVVDLDAAIGVGANVAVVDRIIQDAGVDVQVGGGIRDGERVRQALDRGASRVIVGTRAIEDREWLIEVVTRHPAQVIVAVDVRDRLVTTHGWTRVGGQDVVEFVRELSGLALGGILVTAVHREGRMLGTDIDLMAEVCCATGSPVTASGGIASIDELRALAGIGTASAVLGMSLYTGALDPRAVAEEFSE